ncbi:MAG: hypothetical protein HWD83_09840 [Gammaproteobacteria bacterium]|nr:hypothetical protein [Gammaproteobacteria bacterium]
MRKLFHIVICCLGVLCCTAVADSFSIVSLNPDMPQLSQAKAKMLFTGRSKTVSGVGRIVLLDYPQDHPNRVSFYESLTGQTISQVNSKWASLAFSGRATPPDVLENLTLEGVTNWLQENPNGLAYVKTAMIPDGAYILLEVEAVQ